MAGSSHLRAGLLSPLQGAQQNFNPEARETESEVACTHGYSMATMVVGRWREQEANGDVGGNPNGDRQERWNVIGDGYTQRGRGRDTQDDGYEEGNRYIAGADDEDCNGDRSQNTNAHGYGN